MKILIFYTLYSLASNINIYTKLGKHFTQFFSKSDFNLKIEYLLDSNRISAAATKDLLDNPIIRIHGGILRNSKMSPGVFLLILCHEMGHFNGGSPKAIRTAGRRSWSSAEGQADYYSTLECLPKMEELLSQDQLDLYFPLNGRPIMFSAQLESLAELYFNAKPFGSPPSESEKDYAEVRRTNFGHPNAQCRLDTLKAGLMCSLNANSHERETCQDQEMTRRPRCWYHPIKN